MSRDGVIRMRGRPATIEQPTESSNTIGETEQTAWTVFADHLYAMVQPLGGTELFAAQQRWANVTHRIPVTPFVDNVTPKMRLNVGGTLYDILGAFNVSSQRELELYAVQRGV